jgi:hypothetical protein
MIWADGSLYKYGYLGQGLYVDPARNLVIAWFGTGMNYDERSNDMLSMARQVARSGLFVPSVGERPLKAAPAASLPEP